jgi:hypothetical protein
MQQFLKFYYLTFVCGSTCFGRPPAHHQERITALGASGSTVGRKRLVRTSRFPPTVEPEAHSAVIRF